MGLGDEGDDALVLVAVAAVVTLAAGVQQAHGHLVAGLDALDGGAHGLDGARGLVAAGERVLVHDALVDALLQGADGAGLDLDEDLAAGGLLLLQLAHLDGLGGGEYADLICIHKK